ncbi:MAG: hypothetical protein DRJ18_02610 [Candidatus Methanomethylicota archaeon]|nr:MAG: hypothetical protein DRJ18_02610 [Candidatus Verstraetearchaeota archaeon]
MAVYKFNSVEDPGWDRATFEEFVESLSEDKVVLESVECELIYEQNIEAIDFEELKGRFPYVAHSLLHEDYEECEEIRKVADPTKIKYLVITWTNVEDSSDFFGEIYPLVLIKQ